MGTVAQEHPKNGWPSLAETLKFTTITIIFYPTHPQRSSRVAYMVSTSPFMLTTALWGRLGRERAFL